MPDKCAKSSSGICPVPPLLAWATYYEENALEAWRKQADEKDEQKVLNAGAEATQIQAGVSEEIISDLQSLDLCLNCPHVAERDDFLRWHTGKETM